MAQQNIPITISQAGLQFITNFEGFRSRPYKDTGGLWTIGYGTQISKEEASAYATGIAVPQALQFVHSSLNSIYPQLAKCPLNGLFQNQWDALLDFIYNIGFEAFQNSTVYKKITTRDGDLSSWLLWCKDAVGQIDEGLLRRRRAELKLFIYGLYK
jgi:lysozyme